MQAMKYNYLLLLLALTSIIRAAGAEMGEDQRIISKTFALSKDARVDLTNMYGDVEIFTWDKDSVSVQATMRAVASDNSTITQMLSDINVRMQRLGGDVVVETYWNEGVNFIRKGMYDLKKSMGSNQHININMVVYMPANRALSIKNKFGDVLLDDFKGEFELDLAHGNLRAHNLAQVRRMVASYGRVKVNEIGNGRLLDFEFMELVEIRRCGEVFISSSNSEIEIDKVEVLRVDSKHDDYHIENLGKLNGAVFLTDMAINQLTGLLDLNGKLGEIRVKRVEATCKKISVIASGTDVILDFSPSYNGAFDFDFEMVKNYNADVPGYKVISERGVDKTRGYTGVIGKESGATLSLMLKVCYVRIGGA
jgi:hypothetical protein